MDFYNLFTLGVKVFIAALGFITAFTVCLFAVAVILDIAKIIINKAKKGNGAK